MWDTQRGTAVGSGHGEGPQDPCVSADLALEGKRCTSRHDLNAPISLDGRSEVFREETRGR